MRVGNRICVTTLQEPWYVDNDEVRDGDTGVLLEIYDDGFHLVCVDRNGEEVTLSREELEETSGDLRNV